MTVLKASDNTSSCGAPLTCFVSGNRAKLVVGGEPGFRFSLTDPGTIYLSDGAGNAMRVDDFIIGRGGNGNAFGSAFRLSNAGLAELYVGATLHIDSNQTPGFYSGVYTVTASYE